MTGKITFSNSVHPSRIGGWVMPVTISQNAWADIESVIGSLTAEEQDGLQKFMDIVAHIAGDQSISMSDVRATLKAIEKMTDAEQLKNAAKMCDSTTHALLDDARYHLDGPNFFNFPLRPEKIRAAAWLARQHMKSPGGRRTAGWRRLLAQHVLHLCEARGLGMSISHNLSVSPAVRLQQILEGVINGRTSDDQTSAAKILSEVRG